MENKTYSNLEIDQKELLIKDSIMYMRTIIEAFGAEKGGEVWDHIVKCMGDDLKNDMLMDTILHSDASRIPKPLLVRRGSYAQDVVGVVKAVRNATGLGLYEAKQLWDDSANKWVELEISNIQIKNTLIRELHSLGMRTR